MGAAHEKVDLKLWDYGHHALKEMQKAKLSDWAIGRIQKAMQRLETGEARPGEYDLVRDGVYELRVSADKHWYRLLYGKHHGRFVALLFGAKKTNQLPKGWIATAETRLKDQL
jgi:phage-related protein